MPTPVNIEGQIKLSDGSVTRFMLDPELGWSQWGNDPSKLGDTVDLLDALAEACIEHLRALTPAEDEDEEDTDDKEDEDELRDLMGDVQEN